MRVLRPREHARDFFAVLVLATGVIFVLAQAIIAAVPVVPDVWDNAGFEALPGAGDAVSEADDQFRALKTEIRTRLGAEVHFGSEDSGDDNG